MGAWPEASAVGQGKDSDEKCGTKRARTDGKSTEGCSGQNTKATREKQRRERINERFSTLADLLGLDSTNQDKSTVLLEAISRIHGMSREMSQLKQKLTESDRLNAGLKEENSKLQERLWKTLDSSWGGFHGYNPGNLQTPYGGLQSGYPYPQDPFTPAVPPGTTEFAPRAAVPGYPLPPPTGMNGHGGANPSQPMLKDSHSDQPQQVSNLPPDCVDSMRATEGSGGNGESSPILSMLNDWSKPVDDAPDARMSWLPASALDTSQDHVLRPPVA